MPDFEVTMRFLEASELRCQYGNEAAWIGLVVEAVSKEPHSSWTFMGHINQFTMTAALVFMGLIDMECYKNCDT